MRNLFRVASAAAVAAPLVFGVSPASAGSPELYADLIARHASENGVPVQLASAVIRYESNFNPGVTGRAGEIGLMQIKLQTARGIGYRGSRRGLYDPATNIAWGMKYLGQAVRMAGGSQCGTLSRYNAGLFTRRLVPSYCRQVIARSNLGHVRDDMRVAANSLRNHHVRHGVALAAANPVRHARAHETRVADVGRRTHGHHHALLAANAPVRHVRHEEVRVAWLEQAGKDRPARHPASQDQVLAFAGDPRLSRVDATRRIFDAVLATDN